MQKDKIYNASIIGGGLAGLTLAIQLADAGYSCIVFEKNKYPFHKVCGEYISNESKNFLERVGVNLSAMNLPEINNLQVSSPSGKLLKHQLDLGGFGISRYKLDDALAVIARRKGVFLLEDCKVNDVKFDGTKFTIATSKGNFESEVSAGAWGKKSNLDTKLEREFTNEKRGKNYVGIKYHVKIDLPSNLIGLHNFKGGYCGISKIEDGKFCLCYLSDSVNLKKYNGDIKKMEKEILCQNPFLEKYFKEAEFLFAEPVTISNIKIGRKTAVNGHILMLGDAAGNIAPLSGNGMSMAMKSSFDLSLLLNEYFKNKISRDELEKKYKLTWNKQFKKRIDLSKLLQKMLNNTSLTNATIGLLKKMPSLRNAIVRSTHGQPF